MARRLDDFVTLHWAECATAALRLCLALRRARRRETQAIEAEPARRTAVEPRGVLRDLSVALADLGGREWVVVAPPLRLPQLVNYEPVCRLMYSVGRPVLWVGYGSELGAQPGAVTVSERQWGRVLGVPLPTFVEVLDREPAVATEHGSALEAMRNACRAVRGHWRYVTREIEPALPGVLVKWFSTRALAETILGGIPTAAVYVPVEKHMSAQAFVLGARRRGSPSVCGTLSLAVSAPSMWPITDRVLVANEVRAAAMVNALGVPAERVEAVGSLEVDGFLEALHRAPAATRGDGLRLALLLKWPAEFAFGPPEQVLQLLSDLGTGRAWSCVVRPHPQDFHDYGVLERAWPGRVRVTRPGYWNTAGLVETFAGTDLVVAAMGNAALLSIAAGKPTVIYNPDPQVDLGHEQLLARPDLPRHVRLVTEHGALLELLRRAMDGAEPELLKPQPLVPALQRYLFHALDGGTAMRIARAVLEAASGRPGQEALARVSA